MTQQSSINDSVGAPGEDAEHALSTLRRDGERRWLYPTPSRGSFWTARLVVAWVLIAFFTALPIIEINGEPAILLDVIRRRFVIFGAVFHATDTVFLMLFLLISLLSVGLLTALLGRVWCGWGCPQTVYLEFVFRPIERLFEGGEAERKRRDEGPWTFEKAMRKTGKFATYGIVALGLAHTFVAYFVGWDQLIVWMTGPPTEHWGFFFMMAFTTGLILFDFSYFREQMCVTICPYAKLPSVLMDEDSMIVSYDPNRGEPRGQRSRAQIKKEADGAKLELGDCIDCGACVRTCPTGIDIRDGLQLECVNCTQCIDACNDIMESIGKPKGLIRYTSQRQIEDDEDAHVLRPRVVLYSILLATLVGIFGFMLYTEQPVDVLVRRSSGSSFKQLDNAGGKVANPVEFRIRNQTHEAHDYRITLERPEDGDLREVDDLNFRLEPNEMTRRTTWVIAPRHHFGLAGKTEAIFAIRSGETVLRDVSLTLPGPIVNNPESTGSGSSGEITE